MLTNFTFESYRRLLEVFGEGDRRFVLFRDFDDAPPQGPVVLLRHDVDFSPEAALRMAHVEVEVGAKSTYFFLFSAPLYNLLSPEYVQIPRRVAELGHEVGLHYDVGAFERAAQGRALQDVLAREVAVLSEISGTEVRSIAMHNPSTAGADPFRATHFINAYDARFIEQMGYFSDSCGAWRDEFVECVENETIPARFQLTVHPIYWADTNRTRWETLDQLVAQRAAALAGVADQIREIWRNHAGVAQHDARENRGTS